MKHYKTISQLHQDSNFNPSENPMISLIHCNDVKPCSIGQRKFTCDFYMIALKKMASGSFLYGRSEYDHDNGSMSFTKPRQIMEINSVIMSENAFVLFIHEDYFLGHNLYTEIKKYGFFDYEINEALHLSPSEEKIMWELYEKVSLEYKNNSDEFSREIILTHVDSIFKYAQRFYKRQFINRKITSGIVVTKFNNLLLSYFESGQIIKKGLPTVNFLASELNFSSRYLSDLLKQETGKTALEHIHIFLIDEAKNLLMRTENTVAETAYQLGFENPPYFSRLFKKQTGLTPVEYKTGLLN